MQRRFFQTTLAAAGMLLIGITASASTEPADSGLIFEQTSAWQTPYKPVDLVQSVDGNFIYILTDNNKVLIYEPNGVLKGSIPVDEGITAIDTDARGEHILLINGKTNTFTSLAVDFVVDIDVTGSPYKGAANAPVTIAVFSDFEWPYCGKVVPLLEQVLEQNRDSVKLVFKNMPLQFHKFAAPAAKAALAAAEQGKFWEFHDELFALEELSDEAITNIAVKLGLDMKKFNQDINSPKVLQQINKDIKDAQQAGVTGTPTIYINGKKVKNRSLQGFQQMIDNELKAGGKQ